MIEAIICDYARTLVDIDVTPSRFYPKVEETLRILKAKGLRLAVVSRAQDPEARRKELKDLQLDRYFEVIEVIGSEATKDLRPILEQLGVDASNCIVVGDRVKSEIARGNDVGAITIWFQQGKFANETPERPEEEPTYIIKSFSDLSSMIDYLL